MLDVQRTLNCGGQLLRLDQTRIMGILNINGDSFFAGSRQASVAAAVATAGRMLAEGADILDIGGMSSRPGAELIDPASEQERVLPVLEAIKAAHPECILSVDTVYAQTARRAVAAGAGIVNDISGGEIDPEMFAAIAELRVPYVLMHMKGQPKNMQQSPDYERDVVLEVYDYLAERNARLTTAGVHDVIVDPGFGFGKSLEDNYRLLDQLNAFHGFNRPVLAGLSRKSMIWKPLSTNPAGALNGTTALHVIAVQRGASILRVHDVKAAREVLTLLRQLAAVREL